MKRIFLSVLVVITVMVAIVQSCKKEKSCQGCKTQNKPPTAVAGADQTITLPTDSVLLDGSLSNDPDGKITGWGWTKIAGPASYTINQSAAAKTVVKMPVQGVYQFELKVTDDKGASAKDTIEVVVKKDTSLVVGRDTIAAVEYKYVDSVRFDSLTSFSQPCAMVIRNLNTYVPADSIFHVYIRYYNAVGFSGSFYKLDTIPDARVLNPPPGSTWYWYEQRNGSLIIYYPSTALCEWDDSYHDVMIKW